MSALLAALVFAWGAINGGLIGYALGRGVTAEQQQTGDGDVDEDQVAA